MTRIRGARLLLVLLFLLGSVGVPGADPSAHVNVSEVVKKLDRLYRSESSSGEVEMEISTPHWQRMLSMKVWTRGMDRTFIRILSPKKEAGVATLRLGPEMWNYLPKTNKVIKVPPSMMMSSWMGSDFTNDDLVKESSYLTDYTYHLIVPGSTDNELLYVELRPKEDSPTVWARIVLAVRRTDYIPVRQEYYDERDNLVRVLMFSEIRQLGGRTIPSVLEMIPQNKEGHRTVIRYTTAEFDSGVPDEVFSLRNLRSGD